MIIIKKIISILLVLCTLLSAIPYSAFALSWDGSSAGGSTNAVNGSSTGYVIRSTSDSACVVGYRFSAVNSSGGMKVTKVIDVYRNTSNGDNAYSTSAKFSTKYNKKQIITNKNAKLTTTYNQTNCYKEKDMGFTTTLPNPSGVETWQSYEANINKVLSKLGVGSVSNMVYGDKVVIEPLFDVCLAGEYQALTVSEIAYCGRSVLGGSSTGGTSDGTSKTWGFISSYTNRIWPNKLYTPDGQGLWTAASAIGSSSKATFENILTKGYGAGIAYNETTNKTYTIKFNGNGSTSGSMSNLSMTYGVAKNLTANAFSKTGNAFVKWNTKADGSGTSYTNKQSVKNLTSTQGGTVNLYAQWDPYDLKVYYHANGGSISSDKYYLSSSNVYKEADDTKYYQTWTYNSTKADGLVNASTFGLYRTGYTFTKWGTSTSGGTLFDQNDGTVKPTDLNSSIKTENCSRTLYAQWTPNTYTIKFNGNGNTSGSTASMSMTYNVAKSLTANGFKKTGYVFNGWDTKADGSGTDYTNQQSVKNLTTNNGATINLYAKWKPITYTINFNGNGSTGGSTASMSMTYDVAKNLTANGFTKTGYIFDGWDTKADGSGTDYTNKQSVKNLTSTNGATVTLYARWKPITYTIKFNGNGSTGGSTAQMTMTYDVAKKLTANGFTKTGYYFSGWNTKADGSGTSYYNQQNVKNLTTTNGATITLYAQWSTNSYTIAFDGNGNTGGTTSSMTMKFDQTKNLTANGYTKTGHHFVKWNTKADGSGTNYSNQQSVKNLTSTNGATFYLYAQWSPNTYTINFNGNGATSGSTASMSMTYGVAKNLTANGFVRTGHYFNGWNTKADGSGTSYKNQQSVKNLTATNGGSVTLYAQWVPYHLDVYYNANSGSINSDTYYLSSNDIYVKASSSKYYQRWTYDTAISSGLINASTFDIYKTGYTFTKWGTSSSGGTLYDQDDTTLKPSTLNSGIKNGNVTLKLYAQWKPNTYTIKFFGNTHTGGSTASMSMTYDVAKNLTANGFTKTGYVFNGWNTSADGTGTTYTDKQSVKNLTATNGAAINLYAQWKPISYTIKFDGNGATSGSTASMSMTYDVAKNLTANGFKRTSYNFKGWNTKADGSGTSYNDKQSVKNLTTTNGATITLYAKWEYDPVLLVEQCSVYEGTKSDKTTLFGYTKGNVFDDYVYKTDYPTIGDTVWYNIHFPAEAENFNARQYVRYKGGSWTTRDVTLSSSSTSSQYFPIQFTGNYKKITAGQQYFEIEAKTDWIDSSGNVKKSGTVKTFYIPIKPVVHRTQVQATGYEGSVVAYNGSAGSSGKLYSGQHIKIAYKYTADNTWSAIEYLRGSMYHYNGSKWATVYTSNDGYDAAKNKAGISKDSPITLNSSIGTYTVPVTTQNKLRFKLDTWWFSDKTNTLEETWYDIPVVKPDIALSKITLVDASTKATLDTNNLKAGQSVLVRYTYKNNTDVKVYVEGFKNDKSQIGGVYAIPAKSSITVDGYSFIVPNKRSLSIWGGVYLEGMGIYNTDYESNGSNNALTLSCKVKHPLTLQPITPNADYRENTEVITSYWLKNSYSDDYTPAEDVSIKFCVYKGSNLIYSYTKTKAVVPGSQNNLIYFKWKVPIGFNNADVKITAEIVDDGASYNKVEKSYSTIPYKIVQTPDTQFEKKSPSGFEIPADTSTRGTACEWWEYTYVNGEFVKTQYYTGLASGSIKIEPKNTQTATKSGSTWYMNSGYGITMSLTNGVKITNGSYPSAPSGSYTLPQYGYAYFPEYGYSKDSGKITTLNLSNGKWIFSATGSYGNVHFTPLWYPDGEYIIRVELTDMWTPSGMMKNEYKSNRIIIKDSAYDDWYVGR